MKRQPSDAPPASNGKGRRETIVLDASMSAIEAFAAVTDRCIAHINAAAEVARRSDDPEGIHQLRVSIRRLRAAFSVFGPALPPRRPPVVAQLRSLQQKLGAARELDVLIDETVASMPGKRRKRRGMRELIEIVQADRAVRHRRACTALASGPCAELLSRLQPAVGRFVERAADDTAWKSECIAVFAAEALRARRRKARKLGKKVSKLDPQQLHKLRIRIKKLRYAAEFFCSLARGGRRKHYLRSLKDLQQMLGTTHDAVVASNMIARVKVHDGGEVERGAALVEKWANKSFKRATRKLPGAWRRFEKCKQPLKRGSKKSAGQHS